MYIKKTLINYFKYYVTLCDLVIDIRYIYIIISRLLPLYYYTIILGTLYLLLLLLLLFY